MLLVLTLADRLFSEGTKKELGVRGVYVTVEASDADDSEEPEKEILRM